MLVSVFFSFPFVGCLFETATPLHIEPDLTIGNQWMYLSRQFTQTESSVTKGNGDTARYFIHYKITGDTGIAGVTYKLLREEGLAIFNGDLGLQKQTSWYAVRSSASGILINKLKTGAGTLGRLPFKLGADTGFDTANFQEESLVLQSPLRLGISWDYRDAGHPNGKGGAKKTYLGSDEIEISGRRIRAYKFAFQLEYLPNFKTLEWYADGLKVLSKTTTPANEFSRDSLHFEAEFIGNRYFSEADTQAIVADYNRSINLR